MVARRWRGTSGILLNYAVEKGLLVESCIEEHLLIPFPRSMTVPSRKVSIREWQSKESFSHQVARRVLSHCSLTVLAMLNLSWSGYFQTLLL